MFYAYLTSLTHGIQFNNFFFEDTFLAFNILLYVFHAKDMPYSSQLNKTAAWFSEAFRI